MLPKEQDYGTVRACAMEPFALTRPYLVKELRPDNDHERPAPVGDRVATERAEMRLRIEPEVTAQPQRQQRRRHDCQRMLMPPTMPMPSPRFHCLKSCEFCRGIQRCPFDLRSFLHFPARFALSVGRCLPPLCPFVRPREVLSF